MNAYFVYTVRRNQIVQLGVHLLAGLLAVVLLSGMAARSSAAANPAAPIATVTAGR